MARAHRQSLDAPAGAPAGESGAPGFALTPQTRVGELLNCQPRAAMVFVRRRMACAGCELNRFDTLAGAARSYNVPVSELIAELMRAE